MRIYSKIKKLFGSDEQAGKSDIFMSKLAQDVRSAEDNASGLTRRLVGILGYERLYKFIKEKTSGTLLKGTELDKDGRLDFFPAEVRFFKLPPAWLRLVTRLIFKLTSDLERLLAEEAGKEKTSIAVSKETENMFKDLGMAELIKRGITGDLELGIVAKDGKINPVVAVASKMEDGQGNVLGAVVTVKDLSLIKKLQEEKLKDSEDSKRAMLNLLDDIKNEKEKVDEKVEERTRELKEEKRKLDLLAENMEMGAILVDHDGKVLFTNKRIKEMTDSVGKEGEEVLESFFKKFSSYHIKGLFNSCVDGKPRDLNEAEVGKEIYQILFNCLTEIKDGKPWHFGHLVWIREITEARVLERSREEFFAIASHELRTPLTAIRGNMSLIKEFFSDKIKDPEVKEMIEDSYNGSIRLIGIVNDFLDASSLEQGKVSFKKDKVEVMGLIREVVKELSVLAKDKKLSLTVKDLAETEFLVTADKERLKQIIYNLAANALNYTQKGGVVIEAKKETGELKVFVSDTGIGISSQNQNMLFRKFQRAGEKILTRDITKSTGLGLYISKLIMEGMGGKVWLERSEAGKGSVFAFAIPLVK